MLYFISFTIIAIGYTSIKIKVGELHKTILLNLMEKSITVNNAVSKAN